MSDFSRDTSEISPLPRSHVPRAWLFIAVGIAMLLAIPAFLTFWRVFPGAPAETAASAHEASIIASYRANFQPEHPKAGWRYYWNANGPVGDTNSYAELVWNGTVYATAEAELPAPPPARYLRLSGTGGHPGQGPSQTGSVGIHYEHAAIIAFTVPASGSYIIEQSFLSRHAGPKSGGVTLQVFVGDRPAGPEIFCRSQTRDGVAFDRELGRLSAGETIFVAIGPGETDLDDSFDLDFSIGRY